MKPIGIYICNSLLTIVSTWQDKWNYHDPLRERITNYLQLIPLSTNGGLKSRAPSHFGNQLINRLPWPQKEEGESISQFVAPPSNKQHYKYLLGRYCLRIDLSADTIHCGYEFLPIGQ
jgi:hypothetical protein